MTEPVIRAENLTKNFGAVKAVRGVSFSVSAGSIYGLLGPNGAGKSTTIKMLMNLIPATSGRATVLGKSADKLRWRDFQRIGYVSEDQVIPGEMRVGELLAYLAPFYPTWDAAFCTELQTQLQLPADRKLKNLSRGMKMKVALLCSLAFRPELIVLDEPFSGLDPVMREDLSPGLLSAASEMGGAVFLSSHDVEEVERLCDWVGIMTPGRLTVSEPMEKLLARFRRLDVTLAPDATPPNFGPGVLSAEKSGMRLSLIHQSFEGDETLADIARQLPAGSTLEHAPLSLREIYLALARTQTVETP